MFKLLWDTIRDKRECNVYVKNMAKDGSFYWVLANVTPSLDNEGNVISYFSVRRKPKAAAVKTATDLYRGMLSAEQRAGAKDAITASMTILTNLLCEKGMSYDEFVLAI